MFRIDFALEIAQHIINYPKLEIYSLTLSTLEDPIILTEFLKSSPFLAFQALRFFKYEP